ncbi:DUF2989 domain-containing protein [Shewanella sp. VB17]|uniref:DUF2989 domain-containing protein n=1 Tax=Shewanella sp. VB17 TaxID=2739432 RepID=UPI001563C235|nr:DUF2989 domain-containing protein [Shewanella sp. VB17]NRD74051.1 DUF2989 domain-containing protein [Shewanella sp. VB17]
MSLNVVIFTSFYSIIIISVLLGCDTAVNSSSICKKNPDICDDLHQDSWCRIEKSDLIGSRLITKHEQPTSGKALYSQLIHLEKYNKCIELASGVKHILAPKRTNDRVRAFGLSSQSLAELQVLTKESHNVHLAFYHWMRFNDQIAKNKVLHAMQLNLIDDINILANIASHFQKYDLNKAKATYLDVLNRSSQDNFKPEWLLGLANTYQKLDNAAFTYLLSRANILMTDNQVSEKKMLMIIDGDTTLQASLDIQAKNLADALGEGHYPSSEIKRILEKE